FHVVVSFFFQAEDGIRNRNVTGVQTCALPIFYVPVQRVTPTFARPVEARLRKSSCALLSCGAPWPGARLNLDVRVSGVHGLGRGSGRIRSVGVTGRVWGKGQPPQRIAAELTGRRDSAGSQVDRGRIEVAL